VQEDAEGKIEVAATDSIGFMRAVENPKLREVGEQVQVRLKRVIGSL